MNQPVEKFNEDEVAADVKAAPAHEFVTVPETTLPNGHIVPSFQVGKYHAKKSDDNTIIIAADGKPWHSINYHDARKACTDAGLSLITETQYLAIAYQITQQDANWTGGKVGEGEVYRGLHQWTLSEAQDGHYESSEAIERRWHVLANGERVYDFSGNIFSWVFDDLHGGDDGVINKRFKDDDPTLTTAPYPRNEKGMGWRPDGGRDWSGCALMRGGSWGSGRSAGVFYVDIGWPHDVYGGVGFRCTKNSL
jgi:formylglycine-generating enzyme required for sulfatase activity